MSSQKSVRVIILMGVSGAGKTTVGRKLAKRLGWPYYDGDHFHPEPNIDKMEQGAALSDADRTPWLEMLETLIGKLLEDDRRGVLACSALKRSYRRLLVDGHDGARVVYLRGDRALIRRRLEQREGHFMNTDLLESQFDALEEPAEEEEVLTVDAARAPDAIVEEICEAFALGEG